MVKPGFLLEKKGRRPEETVNRSLLENRLEEDGASVLS